MEDSLAAMRRRWREVLAALGRDPSGDAEQRYGRAFIQAWAEPHRRYHGPAHLLALLDRLESWADQAADPALLGLTAFAHDAVYRCKPGEDERDSAIMAQACGSALGLEERRIETMSRWIEATAGHGPQTDGDGQLFLDADLEILASAPAAYDAYAKAIREEYASVPEDAFRAGRAAAMRTFLARPAIYQHHQTPAIWETRARENIAREIEALSSPV